MKTPPIDKIRLLEKCKTGAAIKTAGDLKIAEELAGGELLKRIEPKEGSTHFPTYHTTPKGLLWLKNNKS